MLFFANIEKHHSVKKKTAKYLTKGQKTNEKKNNWPRLNLFLKDFIIKV